MGSGDREREMETKRETLRVRQGGKTLNDRDKQPERLLIYLTGFILWQKFATRWMMWNVEAFLSCSSRRLLS